MEVKMNTVFLEHTVSIVVFRIARSYRSAARGLPAELAIVVCDN